MFCQMISHRMRGLTDGDPHLEPAVVFRDFVCKIDLFSLAQKLSELRPVVHTEVVPYKVSVEAVSPSLFAVQQQVRSCVKPHMERVSDRERQI